MIKIIIVVMLFTFEVNSSAREQNEISTDESAGSGQDDMIKFRFGGQYKNLFTYTKTDKYSEYQYPPYTGTEKKKLSADLNRLRLSPEIDLSDYIHARVDFDNEAIFANYLKTGEFDKYWRTSDYNDLTDSALERDYDDLYYRCKLHRAYIKLVLNDLTITAGRQQIRFGSARLWNPLDLLNPVMPVYVEGAEEQKGTDAVRLEYYLTETAEIDLIADGKRINNDKKLSTSNIRGNVLGRLKFTIGETDISALGGVISKKNIGGCDISTVFFNGLLNGSAVYARPEHGEAFTQASAGYEYNFRSGVYFLIEYFYNQNGLNYNDEFKYEYEAGLITGINKNNYYILSNQLITYNRHYSGIVLSYNIIALLRGELFAIYDFQGRGILLIPSIKYNAFENIDLNLGIMTAHIFNGADRPSDFEYLETYPFTYASLTWYF